jgi:hypothetical protein
LQEQRPRAPLEQLHSAGLFQLPYLVADGRRRDTKLVGGGGEAVMPRSGFEDVESAKGAEASSSDQV